MIGQLTNLEDAGRPLTIMLIGPGRWATKAPELGVPVSFAEISKVSVLCEVAAIREFVIPEISLGTHFFNDLVEMDMLYLAMYPHKPGHLINRQLFADEPNILTRLIPEAQVMESVIRVIDSPGKGEERCICLHADVLKQNAVCYFEERA
jgi:hypothetical protein